MLCLFAQGIYLLYQSKTQQIDSVLVQQIKAGEYAWIDVRSKEEYQTDHIVGDGHIPHDKIAQQITNDYPDKTTPIALYCAKGGRAEMAKQALLKAGYQKVVNAGGIDQVRQLRSDSR